MAETAHLALPLLAAGQAQKHVTVNEALTRLDLLVMLAVRSRSFSAPPPATEGDRHVVAPGASGDWAGREGALAVFVNGGWDFVEPAPGWRAFVEDEGVEAVFASGVWTAATPPAAPSGVINVLEFEHVVSAGGAQATAGAIPAGALVFGVTARVLESVTGPAGWSLGVAEAPTRYGAGLSVTAGAGVAGARGAPLAYVEARPLQLTPEGADFAGGRLKFAVHYMALAAPTA